MTSLHEEVPARRPLSCGRACSSYCLRSSSPSISSRGQILARPESCRCWPVARCVALSRRCRFSGCRRGGWRPPSPWHGLLWRPSWPRRWRRQRREEALDEALGRGRRRPSVPVLAVSRLRWSWCHDPMNNGPRRRAPNRRLVLILHMCQLHIHM